MPDAGGRAVCGNHKLSWTDEDVIANEWRGWNVEYAGDSLKNLRRVGDTPRKKVLIEGLRGRIKK